MKIGFNTQAQALSADERVQSEVKRYYDQHMVNKAAEMVGMRNLIKNADRSIIQAKASQRRAIAAILKADARVAK